MSWVQWRSDDLIWLAVAPLAVIARRLHVPIQPRFNAGQKLHGLWSLVSWLLLGVTGLAIWFGERLPVQSREAAYEWHLLLALFSVIIVLGHVTIAMTRPNTLRAMLGWTRRR